MKSHDLLKELCQALHDEGHSLDRCGDFEAMALTEMGRMEKIRKREVTDRQAFDLIPKGPKVALAEVGGSRSGLYKKRERYARRLKTQSTVPVLA